MGVAEKLDAHLRGVLHRAFSVLVFDSAGRLLLQRRADKKYHSAGLWSNSCCGHPRPGESVLQAGRRRLREEMGFDCELRELATFRYRAELAAGLAEHELDHVLAGEWEGTPVPDPDEVAECDWTPLDSLERAMIDEPSKYSAWLPLVMQAFALAMKGTTGR
ncbi:MAG: isopentenyl-diphosphate Delta-isomerase [Gemmatimonadota bacterium]|nr:isopentenyl-diphosphate Delta-isomerase [Gemmatimonadota bacterium]